MTGTYEIYYFCVKLLYDLIKHKLFLALEDSGGSREALEAMSKLLSTAKYR